MWNSSKKAFVIDESSSLSEGIEAIKSHNLDTEGFNDCEKLLFSLQSTKKNKFKIGVIHQNGSSYVPQILYNFIKKIDPTIQIFIYKHPSELRHLKLT